MLFVAYKVRSGKISDMHMPLSRERYIPYSIAILAGFASVGLIMFNFDADPTLQVVTLVSIVELTHHFSWAPSSSISACTLWQWPALSQPPP